MNTCNNKIHNLMIYGCSKMSNYKIMTLILQQNEANSIAVRFAFIQLGVIKARGSIRPPPQGVTCLGGGRHTLQGYKSKSEERILLDYTCNTNSIDTRKPAFRAFNTS